MSTPSLRTPCLCHDAILAALLLLRSVVVLYSHIALDRKPEHRLRSSLFPYDVAFDTDLLLDDAIIDSTVEDRIDELDIVDENEGFDSRRDDEVLRGIEMEVESVQSRACGFYYDHVVGVIRRQFEKRSINKWEEYAGFDAEAVAEDQSKGAFASDDSVVDEAIGRKIAKISGIEDVLLLKTDRRANPLREGWGHWFEKKGDFLRKDRTFKSSIELLNPINNMMLQEPKAIGVGGLTRGDKLVQRLVMLEHNKVPFTAKEHLSVVSRKINSDKGRDKVKDALHREDTNI